MLAYTIIITIAVIAFICYKVFMIFNGDSAESKLNQATKELQIIRKNYDDLLSKTIDPKNPAAGGMPGGTRVESIDDL